MDKLFENSWNFTRMFIGSLNHAMEEQGKEMSPLQKMFENSSPVSFWSFVFYSVAKAVDDGEHKHRGEVFESAENCKNTLSGIADCFITVKVKGHLIRANPDEVLRHSPSNPEYGEHCKNMALLSNRLIICSAGNRKQAYQIFKTALEQARAKNVPQSSECNIFALFVETMLDTEAMSLESKTPAH